MADQLDRIELPQPSAVNFDAIPVERLREMASAGAGRGRMSPCAGQFEWKHRRRIAARR